MLEFRPSLEISPQRRYFFNKEPRNRFQGIANLCSLEGRDDNPIPTRFLAPIHCSKIPEPPVFINLFRSPGIDSQPGGLVRQPYLAYRPARLHRTRGKAINPLDCQLVYNSNEIGLPENQALVYPIERIHNEGDTKNFKLLGILFDEYLSFDDHIASVCTKISKSLFCINRVKKFVNESTKKTLYFAMVHSHIVYCMSIYSCAYSTSLNKLRVKQKEAIRIICNAGYREHTAPLFKGSVK